MNQRPTSYLLRDKITFSEQESRYLKRLQKLQKHQNQHHITPPEFNHASDETQTEIIPTFDPIPPLSPLSPSTPSTPSIPSIPSIQPYVKPPLIFNPIGWGPRIYNLGDAIHKSVGSPLETRSIDDMMEDAAEALELLGL